MTNSILLLLILIQLCSGSFQMNPVQRMILAVVLVVVGIIVVFLPGAYLGRI